MWIQERVRKYSIFFFPLRYKYTHPKYSTTPNKCPSGNIGSNFEFYTSSREPCRNLFRGHTLLSPVLEVRLWHCLQRRYFSHWSKRNSLSEARSKAFSSKSRCFFMARLLSQSSCKHWLSLFTRSTSAALSAKCLEGKEHSDSIHNAGKELCWPWEPWLFC